MPTSDDYTCDVTDSLSSAAIPSIHGTARTPEHDVIHPTSHAIPIPTEAHPPLDIEHVLVQDDPRGWSRVRKTFTLCIVSSAAVISLLGMNIYNPGINEIKAQLHATDQEISLSLSIFILVQGITPLLWSALSEIQGRKFVYIVSISLYVVACGVAGAARSTGVLIAMRIVQALGGSAVITIGAATLADIYEPCERGAVVGIYYAAPLLGPSIGPLIGGVLTQALSWRATFYFIAIFAGLSLLSMLFFRDTFRQERSLTYQRALQRRYGDAIEKKEANISAEEKETHKNTGEKCATDGMPDLESAPTAPVVHLSMRDVNPVTPLIAVMRRRNNLTVLFSSAFLFGFSYCITYTVVRTFAAAPYNYGALDIGLVLLSYGMGCVAGSILGGRWSDHVLGQLKIANGGHSSSEDRLQSTKPMMLVLPLSLVAYGWMAEKKVHVAGICVVLILAGLSSIWIYSSSLAYVVDANAGRSSTAVASNSFVRGFMAFIATETAVPLQDAMGDGGLYTLWAGLTLLAAGLILMTIAWGGRWRDQAEAREKERERNRELQEGRGSL